MKEIGEKRKEWTYVCMCDECIVRMCLCMYAYDCANMYVSEVIRDRERNMSNIVTVML